MKNILIALFSFMLVLPVSAEVISTSGANTIDNIRQNIKNIRNQEKEKIQGIRQTIQQIENDKENFQNEINAERAKSENVNTIQTRKDELKIKLQKIKDGIKKTTIERIDQNIADLNSRMTTHYVNVLNQITDVLKRIVSRTDTVQTNGKDVTAVRIVIAAAQDAITAARGMVAAQVSKVYSINIVSNTTLKGDVGATRQALGVDLKKAEDSVKAARSAVQQAAVALGQIQSVDELKESTSTATSTN